jgi:hypothetical protein
MHSITRQISYGQRLTVHLGKAVESSRERAAIRISENMHHETPTPEKCTELFDKPQVQVNLIGKTPLSILLNK